MVGSRPATLADIPHICRLWRTAALEAGARRGGELWAAGGIPEVERSRVLETDLADPDRLDLVGTADGVVLGFARVRKDPTGAATVTELYTRPEARGVGVGHSMLAAALGWARAQGCTAMDASTFPGDRATKNFFEDHGLVARLLVVSVGLAEPG